jgi:hypothetical protein
VTDRAMLAELRATRERGYAVDDEESEVGLRCVGVAIRAPRDRLYGLSISGPSHLFSLKVAHEAGPVLAATGESIASQLRPGQVQSTLSQHVRRITPSSAWPQRGGKRGEAGGVNSNSFSGPLAHLTKG